MVCEELRGFVRRIEGKELERWRRVGKKMRGVMEGILEECLRKAEEMVEWIVEVEMGYVNTNHPDFIREVERNTKSTNSSNKS